MSLAPELLDDYGQAIAVREEMERFLSSLKSQLTALDSKTPNK